MLYPYSWFLWFPQALAITLGGSTMDNRWLLVGYATSPGVPRKVSRPFFGPPCLRPRGSEHAGLSLLPRHLRRHGTSAQSMGWDIMADSTSISYTKGLKSKSKVQPLKVSIFFRVHNWFTYVHIRSSMVKHLPNKVMPPVTSWLRNKSTERCSKSLLISIPIFLALRKAYESLSFAGSGLQNHIWGMKAYCLLTPNVCKSATCM